MASKKSGGSAVTAPKGHATASRNEQAGGRRLLSPTMEWIIAVIVITAIIAGIIYVFGDVRSSSGGHSGAPADAPVDVPVDVVVDLPAAIGA